MEHPKTPLLEIRKLSVRYHVRRHGRRPVSGPLQALEGVSFELGNGEATGILGESGCGKTTLALTVLGLLPPEGEISAGSIHFRGRRLDTLGESELRKLRGAEISLIHQDPALALHPMRRVRHQVAEVLRAHRAWERAPLRRKSAELLDSVGLRDAGDAYPHQLSGGQRQRVVIAQALACRPALVIADEPTASLDTSTQREVLGLLASLRRRLGISFLYISHDPQVLEQVTDRLLVMYAGRLVEEGPSRRVLERPRHPYAEALLRCLPPLPSDRGGKKARHRLPTLEPDASSSTPRRVSSGGCRFAPLCEHRLERCWEREPPPIAGTDGGTVWCFLQGDDNGRVRHAG